MHLQSFWFYSGSIVHDKQTNLSSRRANVNNSNLFFCKNLSQGTFPCQIAVLIIPSKLLCRFQTNDGIFRQESGSVKNLRDEDANEIRGQYSYVSPEGETITVNYVADETGFHATGSHIPQAPEVGTVHERKEDGKAWTGSWGEH